MIDFNKLRTLMSKARSASAGKPLDNVKTLSSPSMRQGDNMNNTRLFMRSDKDWSVQLHNNTIAVIQDLDGASRVTLWNIDEFCTNTTAARVGSVLGGPVWRQDGQMWTTVYNTGFAQRIPIFSGAKLISTHGRWCIENPEKTTHTREFIDKKHPERGRVLATIGRLRALGRAVVRVGDMKMGDTIPGAALLRFPGTLATFCEGLNRVPLDEIEIAHAQHVISVGAGVRGSWWRAVNKDKPVELEDLERGLATCKQQLFRINGVFASERIQYELEIPPAKLVNNNGRYSIVSGA